MLMALALALLLGLQPVLTDLYLPALPLIARDLGAPLRSMQMTMSALVLAFGLMQLVWGPLADRIGRRPVLVANLALLAGASLGASLSTSIGWLIAWRVAQGATVAAAVVCARAMVRDLYAPSQGAHVMSLGLSGLGVLAIVSPAAGGLIASAWGWRANLATVSAAAALAWCLIAWYLPETLPMRDPQALRLRVLARNAREVLAHPGFRAWSLLVTATYSGLFILLSASSYAYIGVLGLSTTQYGLAMASGSVAYILGTFACRPWLRRYGLVGTVLRCTPFTLAGGLSMAGCALLDQPPLALVLVAQWLFLFGHGFHQPCGQTGAVGPFRRTAGLAAAMAGCILALGAFGAGLWLGGALDGTLRPLGWGLAGASVATTAVAWTLVRRHGHLHS
jgi:MFS transporter, DHA1 family, multidrug resistance protein